MIYTLSQTLSNTELCGIFISMSESHIKHIGNMTEDTITSRVSRDPLRPGEVPSYAEQWAQAGIEYRLTDPVPTPYFTAEQLAASGLVGVELILPSAEE